MATASFHKSAKSRPPSPAATGCVCAFFGLFLLVGLGTVGIGTLYPLFQVVLATTWTETPCTIDYSTVIRSRSSKGSGTYRVEVVYHYQFEGRPYTSKRYQFATGASSGRDRKQRVVDQYLPGTQTNCYVNPRAPSEAVIHRGPNVEMLFGLFGLIFAAVGGGGVYFILRSNRKPALSRQPGAVPKFAPVSGAATVLKPQIGPLGKFLMMFGFAVFWNGFMTVFAYLAYTRGAPLPAKLFIGLFCLIGIVIFLGSIGAFFAIFNPRIKLIAVTNSVPLGGQFRFQWSVTGRAEKLRKIHILLEGREEAISTSTSTHTTHSSTTHTQVFASLPVLETLDRELLSQGSGQVTIPSNSMHTFAAQHNRIVWILRVRGEIPKWPDSVDEYPINVLPHAKS